MLSSDAARGDCAQAQAAPVLSLWELAASRGFATGVVTTTRVTHATPGATFSHDANGNLLSDGTRTYTYDGAINPFVHMKWPMLNFAHDSKNNVVEERLDNTSIYLQRTYTYDADGFVKEVVKREVNGSTNETRGVFKTVYVY